MNVGGVGSISEAISAAMVECGWKSSGRSAWSTSLTNGSVLPVSAWLDDGWLRAESGSVEPAEESLWRSLVAGTALPAPVRIGLTRDTDGATATRFVVDLDALTQEAWPGRIQCVSESMRAAASWFHDGKAGEREPEAASPLPEFVRAAIREAGWAHDGCGEAGIDIPLYDDRVTVSARAEARAEGFRFWVPLAKLVPSTDAVLREAAAAFLLHSSYNLRAVRAAARQEGDLSTFSVGWEVRLSLGPKSEEIDRALAALAVACRYSLREVAALSTPALARRYLFHQGARSDARAPITAASTSR